MDRAARPEKALLFPLEEYHDRLRQVRERIARRELDALVVSSPENIYYLSGYRTPGYYAYQCLVVPLERDPFMVVRHLEATNVVGLSWIEEMAGVMDTEDPVVVTRRALAERRLDGGTIGLELGNWFLTAKIHLELAAALPGARIVDASGTVEPVRLIKSPREIELIRRAAGAAQAGMQAGIAAIEDGATENDVAAEVYRAAVLHGSEYMSLPPFIASGPRSALAHATWEGRRIDKGNVVFLENSGVVGRYAGALMRTAVVGKPDAEVRRRADVVVEALTRAIAVMRPGVTSAEVDRVCRGTIAEAGLGELFRHRTGYSIGVNFPPDWGEGQIMSLRHGDPAVLEAGMVFHLVPAVLEVGKHGIGFSETVLVTPTGHEILTSLERRLAVC